MEPITWKPKKVKVSDLKDNPKNPKITTDVGRRRLQKSLSRFGLAGTIICNTDGAIIDGHSRKKDLEEQGVTEVYVSVPNRPLTEKEYEEFNALIDVAKAGTPDMVMIEEVISEEVLQEFELDKEERLLPNKMQLKPINKVHVLLSFPPEKIGKIMPMIQKISELTYVECEQTIN